MTQPLSPAAQAIWEAFNEDEAGVFVDYGDKLAAAPRALADQVVPEEPRATAYSAREVRRQERQDIRAEIFAIAAELEGGR